jgi:hypothetical protein
MNTTLETNDAGEIVGFLHRFAEWMSKGIYADNLHRAAELLEAHVDMLRRSNELLRIEKHLLRAERGKRSAACGLCKSLEYIVSRLESEIINLKSELAGQKQASNDAVIAATKEQDQVSSDLIAATKERDQLLIRVEQAEAQLAVMQSRNAALGDTHILVPITALLLAEAQFQLLAHSFGESGDINSQEMCAANASNLDHAVLVATAPQMAAYPEQAA